MSCICLPWTPQEIKDKFNTDVFQEALNQLNITDINIKRTLELQLWARFRNRMIGSLEWEKWLIMLKDQAIISWNWYQYVADTYTNPDLISHTDNSITEKEKVKVKNTTKTENLPDVPISTTVEYLSVRQNDDGSNDRDKTINYASGRFLETTNKVADDLRQFNEKFVREFDYLFSNRW